MLGAMEVDQDANLANWIIPGKYVKGMGGAMDLVSSDSQVFILMEHTARGRKKILKKCSLPLTGQRCVSKIITELGVFAWADGRLTLTHIQEGVSIDEIKDKTEAEFFVDKNLHVIRDS